MDDGGGEWGEFVGEEMGLPCPVGLGRLWELLLQEVDGGDEVVAVDEHH